MRALIGKELHGYQIIADLRRMGINSGHNYVYTILSGMEERGLLTGRWEGNRTRRPSKHFYTLSDRGRLKLEAKAREAIDLLNALFLPKLPMGSPAAFRKIYSKLGAPLPTGRFVIAAPDSNPAVSNQMFMHQLIAGLPDTSVYFVKPPEFRFYEPPSGTTVLDGRRNNLPFKDEFADSLLLFGIPSYSTVEETIGECARVLNKNGSILVKHPNSLTTDRAPKAMAGYEYFGKLFYEIYDRDKVVSIRGLMQILSSRFESVKEGVFGGSTWACAHEKKS